MTRLAIIADDLTGALDAAAPFAARGLSTVVALGIGGLDEAVGTGADIVGVSSDSREIGEDAARKAVALCVARLNGTPVFKKVDSRLKGNIAAELDALPFLRGLAVPAIPTFGRWSRDGKLGGFGVAEPIDIAARLGQHAGKIAVPDAATQADIELALAGDHDLLIGARGLAEALAGQMSGGAGETELPASAAPAICIIGSTDPITLAQVERLCAACPGLDYRAAPDGVLADSGSLGASLTVVQAVAGGTDASSVVVARRLAEALVRLAPQRGATLFISGGATAQIVLQALGISVLKLLGEALPGLPLARAGGFTVITKSGGFGEPDALVDLFGHLAGLTRESKV